MTVYVDEIRRWSTKRRIFENGSCHLTADRLEELHDFAARLGMKSEWFQLGSWPHYDLTPKRRERALELGAVFVPGRQQARHRILLRHIATLDWVGLEKYPESTVRCANDHLFRSHARICFGDGLDSKRLVGIVSRVPCPQCGAQYNHRAIYGDKETMTIGGRS